MTTEEARKLLEDWKKQAEDRECPDLSDDWTNSEKIGYVDQLIEAAQVVERERYDKELAIADSRWKEAERKLGEITD
jgi:hypothetical protein